MPILVTLVFFFLASLAHADVIDDCPIGSWCPIPNSSLNASGQVPTPAPPGGTGPSAIFSAWNSGAFGTRNNRLIIHGGGHQDYAGNEIYAFSFYTFTWSRLWGPSPNLPQPGKSCTNADTYSVGRTLEGGRELWQSSP